MTEVTAMLQVGCSPHVPHHVTVIHHTGPLLPEAAATPSVTSCGEKRLYFLDLSLTKKKKNPQLDY